MASVPEINLPIRPVIADNEYAVQPVAAFDYREREKVLNAMAGEHWMLAAVDGENYIFWRVKAVLPS